RRWIISATWTGTVMRWSRTGMPRSSPARRSGRCWPTRCRASRRRATMPTLISDGQAGGQPPDPRGIFAKMKEALREQALAEGFSAMGICRPDAAPQAAGRLREYLAAGRHGQMEWVAERE